MMPVRRGLGFLFLVAVATAGCAHGNGSTGPIPAGRTNVSRLEQHPQTLKAADYTNRFQAAQLKHLKDSDIDAYIDSSVVGADRVMAHKLMAMIPSEFRGDFVYIDKNDRAISNNPALLRHLVLKNILQPQSDRGASNMQSTASAPTIPRLAIASNTRQTRSYTSCGPGATNNGPSIRLVSACGYVAAIGIVTLECGTSGGSRMGAAGGDNGYLSFELNNLGASRIEAGLQYFSDNPTGLQGSGGLFAYVNNGSNIAMTQQYHYPCGQRMVLAHGLTKGSLHLTYSYAGEVPSSFNPASYWAGQPVQFNNPSILFRDAPYDMANAQTGQDTVGNNTPCVSCAITRVTAIKQTNGPSNDGSTFGYNASSVGHGVHWEQVAFGEWQEGCQPGAQYCYLQWSRNWQSTLSSIDYNYGVSGNPPFVDQLTGPTSTNFGPWETFESIIVPPAGNVSSSGPVRHPDGAFSNAPMPNCNVDAYGYCVAVTGGPGFQTIDLFCGGAYGYDVWVTSGEQWYYVLGPNGRLTWSDHKIDPECGGGSDTWTPSEPRTAYGDPNLP